MADVRVSLVYVDAHAKVYEELLLIESQATIGQAIKQSQFLILHPEYTLENLSVGVYGLRKPLNDELHEGDRIEIYRPLLIDPKERRRRKVDGKRDPKKWRQTLSHKKRTSLSMSDAGKED